MGGGGFTSPRWHHVSSSSRYDQVTHIVISLNFSDSLINEHPSFGLGVFMRKNRDQQQLLAFTPYISVVLPFTLPFFLTSLISVKHSWRKSCAIVRGSVLTGGQAGFGRCWFRAGYFFMKPSRTTVRKFSIYRLQHLQMKDCSMLLCSE